MWSQEEDKKKETEDWSSTAVGAVAAIGAGVVGAVMAASTAVGPQAEYTEVPKLLGNFSRSSNVVGSKISDGLLYCSSNVHEVKDIRNYITEVKHLFVNLAMNCPEYGIVDGNCDIGYGRGFNETVPMNVFWAYGVGHHCSVHTSLAVLYKSSYQENKFIMIKLDLQTDGGDMASNGNDIFILHEVKLVDGINRSIWNEQERTVELSLTGLFTLIHERMENMERGYGHFFNNCIRFKNDFLGQLQAQTNCSLMVPSKEKVNEVELMGTNCLKCWI